MARKATAARSVLARLRSLADPANVAGMARYGISTTGTLGVRVVELRRLAREIRRAGRRGAGRGGQPRRRAPIRPSTPTA